ncbi:MmgE/PrpD family protein [Pelagibacterium sediminicola]|uniref:MmgE/PrpD family protein n=1 Tax=Pelagibacterium sediminicola TaxID=2248761 RepID=UPI000E3228AD|nr:MmgE/PrpD family protein [Pelagibacterium sediminicola]
MTISDREWVRRHLALADTPVSAEEAAILGMLTADTVAIAHYARAHRVGGTAHDDVAINLGKEGSVVWGTGQRAPFLDAAFLNGSAAEALDFQEVLLNGRNNGHAAVVIVPAVLALAEQRGSSPDAVLRALRSGFVANIGFGEALGRAHRTEGRGFRTTSLTATPAAALACAALLEADLEAALAAVGIAACALPAGLLSAMSPAVGSYSQDKDLSVGFSARHALHSALLAHAGATGPEAPITGDKGWLASYASGSADTTYLDITPEDRELSSYSIKLFPANFGCQAAIRCAIELGQKIDPSHVEHLEVRVKSSSAQSLSTRAIDNHLAARFSLPFAVASAFVRKRSELADFEGGAVADAGVLEFMSRVEIVGDDQLEKRHLELGIFPARMTARGPDGVLAELAYDGPFHDMSETEVEAAFAAKLTSLTGEEIGGRLMAYARNPAASDALALLR